MVFRAPTTNVRDAQEISASFVSRGWANQLVATVSAMGYKMLQVLIDSNWYQYIAGMIPVQLYPSYYWNCCQSFQYIIFGQMINQPWTRVAFQPNKSHSWDPIPAPNRSPKLGGCKRSAAVCDMRAGINIVTRRHPRMQPSRAAVHGGTFKTSHRGGWPP